METSLQIKMELNVIYQRYYIGTYSLGHYYSFLLG